MRGAILFAIFFLVLALVMWRGRSVGRALAGMFLALLLTSLFARSWVQVPAGFVGTVYNPFAGGIQNVDMSAGWHFIAPWANMQLWSIRTQEYTMSEKREEGAVVGDDSMVCQTKEGLQVKVDTTVLFRIDPGNAHQLWKTVGPGYVNTIVRPSTREAVRSTVSQYPIMSVYSNAEEDTMRETGVTSYPGKRKEVEDRIFQSMEPTFRSKGIQLERVLLRNVAYMSESFEQAIVNKQVAQQQVLTQDYLLQIEKIKAQQKTVQAEGQAEAIRLRGISLRANPGVINYEFVRNLPPDLEINVLPGPGGNVILNLPATGTSVSADVAGPRRGNP